MIKIDFIKLKVFVFGLFIIFSCSEKKEEIIIKNNISLWIDTPDNYSNPNYRTIFFKEYATNLKHNKPEKAQDVLHSYCRTVNYLEAYDSILLKTAIDFTRKPIAKQKNKQIEYINFSIGNQYYFINKIELAQQQLLKTIRVSDTINFDKNLPSCYLVLGNIEFQNKNLQNAILNYQTANRYYEELNDSVNIAFTYSNIANCYTLLGSKKSFDTNIEKAVLFSKTNKSNQVKFGLKEAYNDYTTTNDSIAFVNKITVLTQNFTTLKEKKPRLKYQIYAANVQKNVIEKKYDSAQFYLNKCNEVNELLKNKFFEDESNLYKEMISYSKNHKINNKENLIVLTNQLEEQNSLVDADYYYSILTKNAYREGNYKEAATFLEKQKKIHLKIAKENEKGQIYDLDKKYQNEKKEKEIAQQKAVISKNNSLIIGLFSVLSIVVLGIILYYYRKRKQEAQAETIRQEQFTFQLLQNTEEERSRIAGELHDSVNHDLLNIKNSLINGKTIAVNDVANIIDEVRNISRNLHPATLETLGLEASIESLCERLTEIGLFTTCEVEYVQKLSKAKELQLYRIIQEALNNTLKHGKANAAKVILISENNSLHLEIKDNGNGFDVNQQLNNPKSFGLQSILQRAKAITAKINIDSSTKGTVILLKIPV